MPPGASCFGYFDHDADIGIIGREATLEAAFVAAAEATFALMSDLSHIRADVCIRGEIEEDDPELALVKWLNELVGTAWAEGLALASRPAATGTPESADR
jgi:SHS2 domain-containing protein